MDAPACPPTLPGLWPAFVTASLSAADPDREQQQHEPDHREQAEIEEQRRAHERREARRAIGAAQLAIHVERYIEHREKDREFAEDRQVQRSEEHTSEIQSLMRISYDVFC